MSLKHLIFMMLAAAMLLPPKPSVATVPDCVLEHVGQAASMQDEIVGYSSTLPCRSIVDETDNRPQWSDLGMEHLLAVEGQSNISPPSPVRLANQGRRLAGGNSHSAVGSPEAASETDSHCRYVRCAARCSAPRTRGYLYIIQCLRL